MPKKIIKNWDYLDFYKKNQKAILRIINKTIKTGSLILGPTLENFENKFSKYIGTKYGVGVGNCTDAIFIALKAIDTKPGDEIITVSNTAIPTVTSIANIGAIPRFVDINTNYLIDTTKIEKAINSKTKAIVVVHLYGQSCNMNKIRSLAKKYKLKIIEDVAQATGSEYNNKKCGSFGDIGCFSFYPTKILGGFGDGGFLTTNSYKIYKKIKKIRYMGINNKNKYYAETMGINSRLDDVQASILTFKLDRIKTFINKRRKIANIYNLGLKNTSLILPNELKNNLHVYYNYVVRHPKRDKILNYIKKNLNISLNIIYPYPIHKMKAYKNNYKYNEKLINTERYSKEIFSLPLYPELKTKISYKIIRSIKKILDKI